MESNMEPKKTVNRKPIIITAAIAAAVCIALVAVIFAMGVSTEKRLAEQLDLANHYLEELDYEQAVAAFKAAIEIDPKNEDAYLGLADAYVGLGDYESAEEAIEEGVAQTGAETLEAYLEEILAEREKIQITAQNTGDRKEGAEQEEANIEQDMEDGETGADAGQEETDTEQDTEDGKVEEDTEQTAEDGETETSSPLGIGEVTAGQIITFGSYEQDGNTANGKEPIEWYVLEASGGEAVLLSVYLLDYQPYHEDYEDITWENCTLRSWLNSEFYNTAFSAEEQAVIVNTNVVNEDNPYWGTEGGNNTTDKVWLLSLGEIERYFHIDMDVLYDYFYGNTDWEKYVIYCYGQDNRVCAKSTVYAGGGYSEEYVQSYLEDGYDMSYAIGSGDWWLRSPGYDSEGPAHVICGGGVSNHGGQVDIGMGVRPALKVTY